jgi:kynureninase
MKTRSDCLALDARDPLAPLRDHFELPPDVIYLDGNSLGVLPKATPARLEQVVREEWGQGLIRSWNTAGWIDLPRRVGDQIAALIGAGPGEVVAADATSVNLYKVLAAALMLQRADAPSRRRIVSERDNFPTDLYIAQSLAQQHGCELVLVSHDQIAAQLDERCAVLMLTHVNYRTGRMHDMAALTRAAHAAGARVIWDLAHSAGAVPVDLTAADADFAVGCGYKYLNGGPGAPAFVWAHPRHTARMDREQLWQPLSGWLGHAAPFEFSPDYRPAAGVQRFTCGTPGILAMSALACGLDVFAASPGMAALREKSLALTDLFIELAEARCPGLQLVTPREHVLRGSQVSFSHPQAGYPIVQALIERGVIGDFREGSGTHPAGAQDILRFGFTPLYLRFVDVWDAVEHIAQVLESGEWKQARFNRKAAVT